MVIAFEPDSLGSRYLLSRRGRRARIAYLRKAIKILSRLPNATIYAEGGSSDWRVASETARQLRQIGVHRIRGFMLNVRGRRRRINVWCNGESRPAARRRK